MTIHRPFRPARAGRRRTAAAVAIAAACVTLSGCPGTSGGGGTTTLPGTPATTSTIPLTNSPKCQSLLAQGAADPHRFFSDTAQWNIPAACYATRSDSSHWATNWFKYANKRTTPTDTSREGLFFVSFEEYSVPIYDAADATTTIEVWGHKYFSEWNLHTNVTIPWNPSWLPSSGFDKDLAIVDYTTGIQWGIWELDLPGVPSVDCTAVAFANPTQYGPEDMCASTVGIAKNVDGGLTDIRVSDGTTNENTRGMGKVQPLGMLPTIAEVEAGTINHALNFDAYNTLFGPACTAGQLGTAAAGTDCGYAVAPGSRLENFEGPAECGANTMAAAERPNTVPEGIRYSLDLTPDQVTQWLNGKTTWSAGKKQVARTFAMALIDYGWIVSDTACHDSIIAAEGVGNPATAARWAALGIGITDGDLLHGLVSSPSQVRTLQSPWPTLYTNAQ